MVGLDEATDALVAGRERIEGLGRLVGLQGPAPAADALHRRGAIDLQQHDHVR